MRVVLDCNVLVSAARAKGVCREVFSSAARHHQLFLSYPIVAEYEKVAERPEHAFYCRDFRAIIEEIKRIATMVEPAAVAFQIKDPDDEVYLATAAAGNAVLVTGNKRDFTKPRYGSVDVLSPRAFMDCMD